MWGEARQIGSLWLACSGPPAGYLCWHFGPRPALGPTAGQRDRGASRTTRQSRARVHPSSGSTSRPAPAPAASGSGRRGGARICISSRLPDAAGQAPTLRPTAPELCCPDGGSVGFQGSEPGTAHSLLDRQPQSSRRSAHLALAGPRRCQVLPPPQLLPAAARRAPGAQRSGRSGRQRGGGPGIAPGRRCRRAPVPDARRGPGPPLGRRAAAAGAALPGARRTLLPAPPPRSGPSPRGPRSRPRGSVPAPSVVPAPPLSSAGPRGRTMGRRGKSE